MSPEKRDKEEIELTEQVGGPSKEVGENGEDAFEFSAELGEQNDSGQKVGLGRLFRQAREKSGLSLAQLYKVTRLRPAMLEALENEDWKRLPAPVFVTGFVRAYAQALGLSEERMLALYRDLVPIAKPQPKLYGRARKTRRTPLAIPALLLAGLVLAYLFWQNFVPSGSRERPAPTAAPSLVPELRQTPPAEPDSTPSPLAGSAPESTTVETGETPAAPAAAAGGEISAGAAPAETRQTEAGAPGAKRLLRAQVRDRTWVKIYIDDRKPREYILQPGSRPEWVAERGFELIIGNAAGVDLEFDGQKMEKLGAAGQVVRLQLPETYEGNRGQE